MKQKLLILGTGFAAVQVLRKIDLKRFDAVVVSPRNYFLFTPLLTSTTVGTLEFRSIVEPIRAARRGFTYVQARCSAIHPESREISCISSEGGVPFRLPYDVLIIAVGAANNTFGVPGVEEHALFLKDVTDARAIRQEIVQCLEQANMPHISAAERERLLHFVVVGGGPTGVEFAAELHDFLRQDLKKLFPSVADELRVSLIEAADRLLSTFARVLSTYTMRSFKKRNIQVLSNTEVIRVGKQEVELQDGRRIPYGLLVWSGGIAPTRLAAECGFSKDERGRLLVNEFLQIEQAEGIYAAGDCAAVRGKDRPQTAQVAQQQGVYLAKSLNRRAKGRASKPFHYRHMGMLAYIGGNRALMDMPGVAWRGFIAWILWRSIYLTKLVSFKNKVLVLFDWFKTQCFGRDISKF